MKWKKISRPGEFNRYVAVCERCDQRLVGFVGNARKYCGPCAAEVKREQKRAWRRRGRGTTKAVEAGAETEAAALREISGN